MYKSNGNVGKRRFIKKQIATLDGAKKYILGNPGKIFLDAKNEIPFPIPIDTSNVIVHKIAVAHGAKEACKNFSTDNINGSLAIGYGTDNFHGVSVPFLLHLEKNDPVHILDSHNLEIILSELDTFHDFTSYIVAKEEAIKRYDSLLYCGEEDLLACYFLGYNKRENKYVIGAKEKDVNGFAVLEGEWDRLKTSEFYKRRKTANNEFRLWDELIQRTCQNAFDGIVRGNGNIFNAQSAIYEMAKEPRMNRRELLEAMIKAIRNFPEDIPGLARNLSFMPSFYEDTAYVFLQIKHPDIKDYDNEYRPRRQVMLEIACGAAKNRFPHLTKIIGIGIDAPKFSLRNAEDFILLDCEHWPEETRKMYEKDNEGFRFFNSKTMKMDFRTVNDFPDKKIRRKQIPKNEPCPCNSGKKYKRCCEKD